MSTRVLLLCIIIGLPFLPANADVLISGYVLTDFRVLADSGDLVWNENRCDLEVDASPTEDVYIFSQVWIRGLGSPEVTSTTDLMGLDKRKSNPWDLVLQEAYADLYGFLSPNLDLRIGRQRIAWGSADKINPTDNINPDDLEDIWDFGRHVGTNAVLARYYWGDATLTGVLIPAFSPAPLPPPMWAAALSGPGELPGGVSPSTVSDLICLPDNSLSAGGAAALKIAKPILDYDLSLSYYTGRSDFPVAKHVYLSPNEDDSVEMRNTLVYPRWQVMGADLSGAVRDIGIWAEVAAFFPEAVYTTIDMTELGQGMEKTLSLPEEHFIRYVFGGDYTFHNGIYVNGQFIHGFGHELGRDALHDYLVGGMEMKFRNDTVKVTLGCAAEIPDIADIENDYAIVGMPELAYYPADNSEIVLGIRLIEAEGQTGFGHLAEMDEFYMAVKYSF